MFNAALRQHPGRRYLSPFLDPPTQNSPEQEPGVIYNQYGKPLEDIFVVGETGPQTEAEREAHFKDMEREWDPDTFPLEIDETWQELKWCDEWSRKTQL